MFLQQFSLVDLMLGLAFVPFDLVHGLGGRKVELWHWANAWTWLQDLWAS